MNGFVTRVTARIKRSTILLVAIGIFFAAAEVDGQSKDASSQAAVISQESKTALPPTPLTQISGVDVLSDTQGVDFGPYIRNVLATIKKNWLPLVPEEGRPGGSMQGETLVRLSIFPDGRIRMVRMDTKSPQTKIDRAAYVAITSVGQFPPLPAEFKGPYLDLRIDFFTNRPIPPSATPLDHMTGGASMPR
jgi:TonB family protein